MAIYLKFCGIIFRRWCLERSQNEAIGSKIYRKCRIFAFQLLSKVTILLIFHIYRWFNKSVFLNWKTMKFCGIDFCGCSIFCGTCFRDLWGILRKFLPVRKLETIFLDYNVNTLWIWKQAAKPQENFAVYTSIYVWKYYF